MRSSTMEMNNCIMETADRLSDLSIVIDDVDSSKYPNSTEVTDQHQINMQRSFNNRLTTNDSIRRIFEEAERRKHEFWKLLEEHNALIQYLKRIEQLEHNGSIRKTATVST